MNIRIFNYYSISNIMCYAGEVMLLEKYACTVVPKRLEGRRSNFPRRLSVSAASIPRGVSAVRGDAVNSGGFPCEFPSGICRCMLSQ